MGKTKKKIQVPQILVLIMLLILVFCALSYIVPGGEFQLDDNKRAIAGTFQFVGQILYHHGRHFFLLRREL